MPVYGVFNHRECTSAYAEKTPLEWVGWASCRVYLHIRGGSLMRLSLSLARLSEGQSITLLSSPQEDYVHYIDGVCQSLEVPNSGSTGVLPFTRY